MKRILAFLLLAVLCAGLVACADDEVPNGMKNVGLESSKFYLFVPDTWVSQSERGIPGATSPGGEDANVLVTQYLMDQLYTPETYWENKCVPERSATFSSFEVTDSADTTLGGVDAKKYVYTAVLGGNTYRFLEVFAVVDNIIYTLTYTATPEHFDTYLTDVDTICANFRFR